MARQDIAQAVADALTEMGVTVSIDRGGRHPKVLWSDPVSGARGIVTTPGTASDHRSLLNNVRMAQRHVRQARGQ